MGIKKNVSSVGCFVLLCVMLIGLSSALPVYGGIVFDNVVGCWLLVVGFIPQKIMGYAALFRVDSWEGEL